MGFDRDDEDSEPWPERGDGGPSRNHRVLLKTMIECGAVVVGMVGGREVPYEGVLSQLEVLRNAGLANENIEQPIKGATIWVATPIAKVIFSERR